MFDLVVNDVIFVYMHHTYIEWQGKKTLTTTTMHQSWTQKKCSMRWKSFGKGQKSNAIITLTRRIYSIQTQKLSIRTWKRVTKQKIHFNFGNFYLRLNANNMSMMLCIHNVVAYGFNYILSKCCDSIQMSLLYVLKYSPQHEVAFGMSFMLVVRDWKLLRRFVSNDSSNYKPRTKNLSNISHTIFSRQILRQ